MHTRSAEPTRLLISLSALGIASASLLAGCNTPPVMPPTTRPDAGRDTGAIDAHTEPGADVGGDAFSAEDDAGTGESDMTEPYTGPVEGLLLGVVSHAESRALLENVRVTLTPAGREAVTGVGGNYAIPLAPGEYVAHFGADGFLSAHRRVRVEGWERVIVNVSLLPASPGVMVDGERGGTVSTDGTRVTVLGASLVDATGRPVEDAEIAVTPIDPTEDLDGAPGDFVGESGDGSEDPLVSFGMVDIDIETSTGPGEFAPGTTAGIEVPVGPMPPGVPPLEEGDCMPLWWFDPERAIWVEEGEACAVRAPGGGLVLTGNVGRPGTWNCDVPVLPVCYTGVVTDCAGTPMPGVEIRLTGGSVTSSATTRTGRDGTYTVTGAARRGAIIEARGLANGNTYVEQTDFVDGGESCTTAPSIAFPYRYVSAVVRANRVETRIFGGARDAVSTTSAAAAQFWDFERGPAPYVLTCDALARDAFGPSPTGMSGETPSLEVGSPVRLTGGGTTTDLFRVRRGATLVGYGTMFGTSLPEALRFDVEIRGAAGTLPFTRLAGALRMPASFVVTSPAPDVARSFEASALPLRWTTVPGEEAEVSVLVFSRSDPAAAAYAELSDDGSETLSLAAFPAVRGPVTINLQRTVRRYERLETGPSVMLVGTRGLTIDAEIR